MATEINLGGCQRPDEFPLPGGWVLRRGSGAELGGLELLDPDGTSVVALAGDGDRGFGIERAWRGVDYGGAALKFWALAIGRTDGIEPVSVTFTGRRRWRPNGTRAATPERTSLAVVPSDGVWVAGVVGLYLAVTCRQGARHGVRTIDPLPGRWPLTRTGAPDRC